MIGSFSTKPFQIFEQFGKNVSEFTTGELKESIATSPSPSLSLIHNFGNLN